MIGRIFDQLAHLETMTVVAVNRHAVGGGWSLALAADYCLAVPAAQFWVPEVDLGVPFRGLSSFAPTHRLGPWLAKEAVILCRRFSAEVLCSLGVINRVVGPDQLLDEARTIAARFAAQPAKSAVDTNVTSTPSSTALVTTDRTVTAAIERITHEQVVSSLPLQYIKLYAAKPLGSRSGKGSRRSPVVVGRHRRRPRP